MIHKHRIKPGYEGGEYVEGNVIKLTITQHAMWHFAEWQRKGNWQDRVAWQCLSGAISQEEVVIAVLSGAGKKGGQRVLELHKDEMIKRCRENVKKQLKEGTHPFYKDNRSWDQSLSASKAARSQVLKGVHPFQQQNWDRNISAQKAAETRRRKGINCADRRDKGPNSKIVEENKEKITNWYLNNQNRRAKNGRQVGAKVCDDELKLCLTSLQPLVTFLKKLKHV
jgi:hypothetical protein